ncbi:hypothetical protein [Streptomyces flaveolus]|uniref:hypothetical protein n=1 Tax=Streptomyces flaveolus TaxID=67297 RepID=UPI00340621B6
MNRLGAAATGWRGAVRMALAWRRDGHGEHVAIVAFMDAGSRDAPAAARVMSMTNPHALGGLMSVVGEGQDDPALTVISPTTRSECRCWDAWPTRAAPPCHLGAALVALPLGTLALAGASHLADAAVCVALAGAGDPPLVGGLRSLWHTVLPDAAHVRTAYTWGGRGDRPSAGLRDTHGMSPRRPPPRRRRPSGH